MRAGAGRGRRFRRGQALQDAADEAADAVVLLVLRDQLATARQRALWQPLEPAPHDAAPELRRQRSAGHLVDRKSVVSGKSVSVRVDLGGSRIIKKKQNT